MLDPAQESMALLITGFALMGLLLGSFLNVVIYRLPIMMERQWAMECAQASHEASALHAPEHERFNLLVPRSACPACHTPLHWWNNLPLLSFALQKGRCSSCQAPISWRYPVVEMACAILFAVCAWRFGPSTEALAWCGFCAILLAAAVIDWNTTLLPDDLTLPLMWSGMLLSALGWIGLPLTQSVWGAALGYLSLWSVYWLFKLVTGKEGMGYGDFKLLAAMGAWLGPVALIALALIACVLGLAFALPSLLTRRMNRNQAMPFGPYLAFAGLVLVFFKHTMLVFLGLAL